MGLTVEAVHKHFLESGPKQKGQMKHQRQNVQSMKKESNDITEDQEKLSTIKPTKKQEMCMSK